MQHAVSLASLDWCLFLDVDGTLVELAETPAHTVADEPLKRLLAQVSERLGGAVALVSGRSIEYMDALFAPLTLPAAGLHGVERRSAAGTRHGSLYVDERLDPARAALAGFLAAHPGTLLEDKGRSLALHFRLAPQFEASARQAIGTLAQAAGESYHVQEGDMVLEIKPRGFSKGTAVQEFMREAPFLGRKPVFVGDDLTDLAGFRAVENRGGLAIAVGDRVVAASRLEGPSAVRGWLADIAALAAGR